MQSVAAAVCDPGALSPDTWLCGRHAWQASHLTSENGPGSGFVPWLQGKLEAVLAECMVRAARLAGADQREDNVAAPEDNMGPSNQDCVVCSRVETAMREHLAADPNALSASKVCLRHLAMYPPGKAAAEQHGQAVTARLQELAVDLQELIRKSSWQGRHEPKGQEQDAWRRAISLFVGDA